MKGSKGHECTHTHIHAHIHTRAHKLRWKTTIKSFFYQGPRLPSDTEADVGSSQQAGRHIDDREGLHEDNFGYLSKKYIVQYKMQKEKALCCIHGFIFFGGGEEKKILVTLTSRSCRNKNYSYTNTAERSLSLDGIYFVLQRVFSNCGLKRNWGRQTQSLCKSSIKVYFQFSIYHEIVLVLQLAQITS